MGTVVGPLPEPLVRSRCGVKVSTAKDCANPTRDQSNGRSDGASAGAAGLVAVQNKGLRSQSLSFDSKATGGGGGASAGAAGAVAWRNNGFHNQRLCQTHT